MGLFLAAIFAVLWWTGYINTPYDTLFFIIFLLIGSGTSLINIQNNS